MNLSDLYAGLTAPADQREMSYSQAVGTLNDAAVTLNTDVRGYQLNAAATGRPSLDAATWDRLDAGGGTAQSWPDFIASWTTFETSIDAHAVTDRHNAAWDELAQYADQFNDFRARAISAGVAVNAREIHIQTAALDVARGVAAVAVVGALLTATAFALKRKGRSS
jgi:hypothetical protein